MSLDFTKVNVGSSADSIVEPRKIFTTLNRDSRFRRPSDEQGEVLDKWFHDRKRQDNTIKMNTGAGKTLVGLLALQSSLNEKAGPAVYVTADKYLALQVIKEAKDLGISTTEDHRDPSFIGGKSILVITIHRLVNGQSLFGVGLEGVRVRIGSIVIDDAHACLGVVESQFKIELLSTHPVYKGIFSLVRPSLEQQSTVGVLELESFDPQRVMQVPYWSWKDKQTEIAKLLHDNRDDEEIRFVWPLLKEVLGLCQCVFGGNKIEIAPRCLPIDVIPSFMRATRRIYMTATLADDGILISHFKADADAVSKPIKPQGVGDMGDRMILVPQEINPSTTDEDIRKLAAEISVTKNVVVIVPSLKRSRFWEGVANQTLTKDNIEEGIGKMKGGHVGLTVLVNKYDGVDLPGEACELLIIDGLPEVYGLIEQVELSILDGTEVQLLRQIQRIEQGMGRGVRSSEDRCVVLLLGARLTQRIHQESSRTKFTPATLAQIDLGREITKQLLGKPIEELKPILDYSFNENPDWQLTSRTALVNAKEGALSFIDPNISKLREAFDAARNKQWSTACNAVQDAVNQTDDTAAKGYLKQQLAEYKHHEDPVESQTILFQAVKLNPQVLKPITGITYSKLSSPTETQAASILAYVKKNFAKPNDLVIYVNALIEDLSWNPEETKRFETAIKNLGFLFGFGSQRPEIEIGKGPDNLWAVGNLSYYVIECKSGSATTLISKTDCNQLIGSQSWFTSSYDTTCTATPILIHKSSRFDKYSSPLDETRIIDNDRLTKLTEALRAYSSALAAAYPLEGETIAAQLEYHGFTAAKFLLTHTVKFTKEK